MSLPAEEEEKEVTSSLDVNGVRMGVDWEGMFNIVIPSGEPPREDGSYKAVTVRLTLADAEQLVACAARALADERELMRRAH